MHTDDIKIVFASTDTYRKLTIEVFYKGKFLVLINQDQGSKNLQLEFPDSSIDDDLVVRSVGMEIFEKALKLVKDAISTDKQ